MKLTLEFNLPEEQYEAERVRLAPIAWLAISDAQHIIRNCLKYEAMSPSEALEKVNEILWEASSKLEEL